MPLFVRTAFAEDRSFEIGEVEIHARIDRDGNMTVTEWDTYHFDGAFNGVLVDLNASGSDGIESFQAYEAAEQQSIPLEFEETADGDKLHYKIYAKSENETKVFLYTYTVKNVVQVYADTAQLYWKFFDETNPSLLGEVRIEVELPEGAEGAQIQAFGHGPDSGAFDIEEQGLVRYQVSPLPSGKMLEVRMLFPGSYVPGSTKISDEAMLERILEEERRWAEPSPDYSPYGALALLIANLAAGILVYRKYGRKRKSEWRGKYYRELTGDVTPAVVGYLMNYHATPRDLIATLTDLVRKRHVSMKAVKTMNGRRERTDYEFQLLMVRLHMLEPHESQLIQWFFKKIKAGKTVNLSDIRKQAKEQATAAHFGKQWDKWREKVEEAAYRMGYIEDRPDGIARYVTLAALLQFFGFWFLAPEGWSWLMFCAIPLFFFRPPKKRRTTVGQTEFTKWKAFKRFLRDYSRIASREPLAVHLWEHYLVYAIALGEAKRAIAITRLNVPEDRNSLGLGDIGTAYYYYDDWTRMLEQTLSSAEKTVNTSSDSSGGDFSSGGGGGGGGGGRGAF
ncbi:DUF2207 family protein [Cohnella cellulosilytica]|uniref:DUF2207 family protein n=1 Tax=Cohnella cellulosilytica TaxID=986710 RepID=A0ABW2FDR9_9BACL